MNTELCIHWCWLWCIFYKLLYLVGLIIKPLKAFWAEPLRSRERTKKKTGTPVNTTLMATQNGSFEHVPSKGGVHFFIGYQLCNNAQTLKALKTRVTSYLAYQEFLNIDDFLFIWMANRLWRWGANPLGLIKETWVIGSGFCMFVNVWILWVNVYIKLLTIAKETCKLFFMQWKV